MENSNINLKQKVRLIGFYNKPAQNMREEVEYVEEAVQLAELLRISFYSLNRKCADPIFKSILNGNTVFILKTEDSCLYAYYPYKNKARISGVIYDRRHVTPVSLVYKSWFVPGDEIRIKSEIVGVKQYTVTTSGGDFLITKGKRTLPLKWGDTYIPIKDMCRLVKDPWVCLQEYSTNEDCEDCDGYIYNCDESRCSGDCEYCGGRTYICNSRCFNYRYNTALKIRFNGDAIDIELNPFLDILSQFQKPHETQNYVLFNQYKKSLQQVYDHCKFLDNYLNVSGTQLKKFIGQMDYCRELNQSRGTLCDENLLTIYMGAKIMFRVNRQKICCESTGFLWRTYHLRTLGKIYDLVSDSLVEFNYELKFLKKDMRDMIVKLMEGNKIYELYGDREKRAFCVKKISY